MSIAVPSLWLPHIASPFKKNSKLTYAQTVLQDGPVGYWRLQETSGTTAEDSSGNGNPGTYTGGFTLGQTGPFGTETGVLFNGSTGYVTVPSNSKLQLTSPFSLEMWSKITTLSETNTYILDKDNDYAVIYGYSTDNYAFYSLASGAPSDSTTTIPAPDTNWHYISITYDGTTMLGYRDATQIFSVAATFACGVTTDPLTLACTSATGVLTGFFGGTLAECAIYAKALSPTRIAAHYAASGL